VTKYNAETPDEKAERLAQDPGQQLQSGLRGATALWLDALCCAFIQSPDRKGLHDDWVAWLKEAAQIYPQAGK